MKEAIFRIILIITGIINFIPVLVAFLPSKIEKAYGVALPDANFELLLRHRAVLLGIVGGLLLYAAFSKMHYNLVSIVGMVSMISYVFLYVLIDGPINPALTKVLQIDIVTIILLLIGFLLYKL